MADPNINEVRGPGDYHAFLLLRAAPDVRLRRPQKLFDSVAADLSLKALDLEDPERNRALLVTAGLIGSRASVAEAALQGTARQILTLPEKGEKAPPPPGPRRPYGSWAGTSRSRGSPGRSWWTARSSE